MNSKIFVSAGNSSNMELHEVYRKAAGMDVIINKVNISVLTAYADELFWDVRIPLVHGFLMYFG